MWTREELKTRGKAAFLRNYWICVVAALILTLLVGSGTSNSGTVHMGSVPERSAGEVSCTGGSAFFAGSGSPSSTSSSWED